MMENHLRNQIFYKEIVFQDKSSVIFSRCARKESKKLSKFRKWLAIFLKMTSKTEFNEEDFIENSQNIKSQILSTKRSRGYFQWLNSRKDEIKIDDWRYLIY